MTLLHGLTNYPENSIGIFTPVPDAGLGQKAPSEGHNIPSVEHGCRRNAVVVPAAGNIGEAPSEESIVICVITPNTDVGCDNKLHVQERATRSFHQNRGLHIEPSPNVYKQVG